jgi:hypothetical protein
LYVAWIEELERDGRLLGRFTARLERTRDERPRVAVEHATDLAIDDALAWARERAGLVLVRFGRRTGWWSAGATPHWAYPAWPPHDLPPLVERPFAEHWTVTFWLRPDDLGAADRERWDPAVAASAADARLGWDATCLEHHLADMRPDGYGTAWPPEYRVYCVEQAPDARAAEEQASARYAPPEGFRVRTTVQPADE